MNDLIVVRIKKNQAITNIIKTNELDYKAKTGKSHSFSKYSLPTVVSRDIHKENLTLKDADEEQSK